MASGKKSFVLYCDLIHTVELLNNELAGKLMKHLLRYVNDMNPETDDMLLKVAFEPIKRQLKRDLIDWEEKRVKRVNSGHLGGIKSGESRKKKQIKPNEANDLKSKQNEANKAVIETVTANVNVNDNVKERENTGGAHDLKNSNLFRKPKIPTKQQVLEAIVNQGGTKEMAKAFYEKYEGTGWYLNGSPVVNYTALAGKFVSAWKSNDEKSKKKYEPESSSPPLKTLH